MMINYAYDAPYGAHLVQHLDQRRGLRPNLGSQEMEDDDGSGDSEDEPEQRAYAEVVWAGEAESYCPECLPSIAHVEACGEYL